MTFSLSVSSIRGPFINLNLEVHSVFSWEEQEVNEEVKRSKGRHTVEIT